MNFELTRTNRGKIAIRHNGAIFRERKRNKNSIRWTCSSQKSCCAFLSTNLQMDTIIDSSPDHNHETSDQVADVHVFRQRCKRKAAEEISTRPMKIMVSEATSVVDSAVTFSDFQNVRRCMYHERRKTLPANPKSLQETLTAIERLDGRYAHIIQQVDTDNNIVFFATNESLQLLKKTQQIFADGTFKSAPKYFSQLYIIHALHEEQYVACVFFLLRQKLQTTYEAMLDILKNSVELECLKTIHLDFEKAAINAFQSHFPDCQVRTCNFHLGQSWHRKIQECGLSKEYRDTKDEIGAALRACFGLPFLPPSQVSEAFADLYGSLQADVRVERFFDYILTTYIENASEPATFPPHLWAGLKAFQRRTTNGCEAFHRHLNSYFVKKDPSIFYFMEVLSEFTIQIKLKLKSSSAPRRSLNRKKECKLQDAIDAFNNSELTRLGFLHYIKGCAQPPFI